MIDPTTMQYRDSRYEDLFSHLKSKGYDCYMPGQHVGETLTKYLVIKFNGPIPLNGVTSHQDLYAVMCYVPESQYFELDSFLQEVRSAVLELRPMFMPNTSAQSFSAFDEAARGYYITMEFTNTKKD